MSSYKPTIGHRLGDIRAEHDAPMLDHAFYETTDYKTLVESNDRCIVVGRRGTGKSALVYRLEKFWSTQQRTKVFPIRPDEAQVLGIRPMLGLFGEHYSMVKAGAKLAWKYALCCEVLGNLATHYKMGKYISQYDIQSSLRDWGNPHQNISQKLRHFLANQSVSDGTPEQRIANLADTLDRSRVEKHLADALSQADISVVVLIDQLDEGYLPDTIGVGLIDGFTQAVIDLNSLPDSNLSCYIFLRDNIFRALAEQSPDFTRNIEGQVLRLNWDEYSLFNLVCNRLRFAFQNPIENSLKIWNAYTADDLSGKDGFRRALRLTLYRPRDILSLLNEAFLAAHRHNSERLVLKDVEVSGVTISRHRLNDLHKEYGSAFPAIEPITTAFSYRSAKMPVHEALKIVDQARHGPGMTLEARRDLAFLDSPSQILDRLYHVGFLGLFDPNIRSFVFCHDGNTEPKGFNAGEFMLVHPCYWRALSISDEAVSSDTLDDIHDEYEIEISSISSEQRNAKIEQLLGDFAAIDEGLEHAKAFEDWCLRLLRVLFAGSLANLELHANKNGLQRRDIVATNHGEARFWRRILDDYKSRQVVFEVKNFRDLDRDVYRQVNSYLGHSYGDVGFVICRDEQHSPKGTEARWTQELWVNNNKLVIKLSAKRLTRLLRKLRNPQKHNETDKELNNLLDRYLREYIIVRSRD